jgi:hypothetical protein
MESANGNPVANQFLIQDYKNHKEYFQSYTSMIAEVDTRTKKVILDVNKWDYSRTTMKYLNWFLGGQSIEITRKKIASGEIILKDLN